MGDRYSSRDSGRDNGRDRGGREETRGGRDSGRDAPRDDDRGSRGGRESSRDSGRESSRDSGRGGSGSGRGFQYRPPSAESKVKRSTQGANDYDKILRDDVKLWTPKDGKNRVRYLPATWDGADHYGLDIFVHYGVGPDRGSYLDLFKMKGEPDPITEEIAIMRRENAPEDDIKSMESKKRVLAYIVDRDDESSGVQAWAMPWGLDKDVVLLSADDTGGVINPDDPEEGYDIEFTRAGKGIRTEYKAVAIARRSTRLGKAEWLDYAVDNPLPSILKYYTYDEINKVFSGGGAQRDDRGSDRGSDDRQPSRQESRGRDDARDTDRSHDSRDSGGRSGSRENAGSDRGGRGRDAGRDTTPALSWADVHGMTSAELDALVESEEDLSKINPNDAASDAELADWICEDLKIAKPEEGRGRTRTEPMKDDAAEDKLSKLREQRGRR